MTDFKPPAEMSLEEMEVEVRALLKRKADLDKAPKCTRARCDGKPHGQVQYEHEARYSAEASPIEEAQYLDPKYRERDHLVYLSDRLANAVHDVEQGKNRKLIVSMPPRLGKSQLTSVYLPLWLMHKHPDWKIGLISHNPTLATDWGRQIRNVVEESGKDMGLQIRHDAGAVSDWQLTTGGSLRSRSAPGQSLTGLGFKVMLIDDPVKDFAASHSKTDREGLWNWWIANAVTRMEQPYLVVMIGTRWHEDDLLGRVQSKEYDGNPDEWEVISFPAIATDHDVLGRAPGDPLLSPIIEETREEALERWEGMRRTVGMYNWSAQYQQSPAPAKGAIFDTDWWRFWTRDPHKASRDEHGELDGQVVFMDPHDFPTARWVDSWDLAFKGTETSDYVVGQRWFRHQANRFLVAQVRGRWNFTQTIEKMKDWAKTDNSIVSPYGQYVHTRLVEDAANGAAAISTLQDKVSGIKPIQPRGPKDVRARAVTPEIESGNVYLPYPYDPGNEWVLDLLSELRNFPHDKHDDQVDPLTQALSELRELGAGAITVPGRVGNPLTISNRYDSQSLIRAAQGDGQRRMGSSSRSVRRVPGR